MEKLTLVELNEKINLENDIFNKMSKPEKRVAIAKDCLTRIELEQVIPRVQRFCRLDSEFEEKEIDIKTTLENSNKTVCSACAKGSLFMSYVGRVNNFNFNNLRNGNDINDNEHTKLLEIFTVRQLALIEFAFEGDQFIHRDLNGKEIRLGRKSNAINAFRSKHRDYDYNIYATNIMVAICENIIENNGTFII